MIVRKKWIKDRKSLAERIACAHWWELKSVPNRLLSFNANDYFVVCKHCGHRGTLFTKKLDFYEEQVVAHNLQLTNLKNLAKSGEEEE